MTDDSVSLSAETILSLTSECFYSLGVDADGRLSCEWCGGAFEKVIGLTEDDFKHKGQMLGIVHPEDKESFKDFLAVILGGLRKTAEYRIISKDGQTRHLRDRAVPVTDDLGKVVRVNGVIWDISEFKQAKRSLENAEGYYKKLFWEAGDAISLVEPDTEIVIDVNPKACEMYGFTRDEFIGMSFVPLTKQKVRGQTEIRRFIRTGATELYYTVHYTKDGSELEVEISGSFIEVDGRKLLMSIHRDVTGRGLVE